MGTLAIVAAVREFRSPETRPSFASVTAALALALALFSTTHLAYGPIGVEVKAPVRSD